MIRKTRLLAGFMAAVLLSTTCLGGVSAAGEEGITTLNASATEDESTTWNATVTAGETLFPEGTELRFAVADDEKKAAVQEQLMTESAEEEENTEEDTTAGKTLQDLHVYDFGLTNAEKAEIDYTDKVTYSVKSDAAADTDTDATDYVIYRVNEEEDSGEGATVTLEPIENSTGTVKLDGSGWMTGFSVETEPVERIAVAVYKTATAETDESSEEGDGTEEEESAGDVGVSTFAAVNEGNNTYHIPELEKIERDSYAPMNNLLILNNMERAKVEILEKGAGVDATAILAPESESAGSNDDSENAMNYASWDGFDWSSYYGVNESMYYSMRAGEGDTAYGGVAVRFKPAVDDGSTGFEWKYENGWESTDRSLEDTSMKVTLLYTNAGYYQGELINAVAEIGVTPSKNRNDVNRFEQNNGGYDGDYYPMFQASGSLYRGWVWQNVEEFHVDLTFYYASDTNRKYPITLGSGNQSYDSMFADYYTVNSLNPSYNTGGDGEWAAKFVGSEYVLPTKTIQHAYKVADYEVDGREFTSNVSNQYESKAEDTTYWQYAYNGGDNPWPDDYDVIDSDGWAQNSVMIIPSETSTLSFTLGQLEVQPWYQNGADTTKNNYLQSTNIMWATISTRSFTQTRVPVNIDFEKKWADISSEDLNAIESVSLELRLAYDRIVDPGETDDTSDDKVIDPDPGEETLRSTTLSKGTDGSWKGTFNLVPDLNFYQENGYVNPGYVIREIKITYKDGTEISADGSDFPFDISGDDEKIDDINRESEGSYNIRESFEITNTEKQTGTINIQKLSSDAEGDNAMPKVTFSLQKANVDEQNNWTPDPNSQAIEATTNASGQCSFTNLEEGYYLLTETKTQPGYTLLKEPVKITLPYVVSNGTASSITGNSQGIVRDDGTYYYNLTYTITNGQSFDLPQTGGTSADRIMRTGMVLFATAAGALLYLNRKRRREQQKN